MYNKIAQRELNKIIQNTKEKEGEDLSVFYTRLGANCNDIFALFNSLYGHLDEAGECRGALVSMLLDMYRERPEECKQLDLDREDDPDWYLSNKLVATMLYVDRYAKNLQGVKEKIPYLRELGINTVHLMPLLKSPKGNSDGGYAVSDYHSVDPKFGTMDDLNAIGKEFRRNGMHLVLDLVLNHTSDEHEWAKKALKGNSYYQNFYYMFDTRTEPNEYSKAMPEIFPNNAPGNFTYVKSLKKWVMTVFHKFQWDLNYKNPHVFIEMLKVLLFLANQGVDIIRLDAVPYLWKKKGTTSINLEEAHTILRLIHACTKVAAPGIATIAEAIVQPNEVIRYLGEGQYAGRECEFAYHASFMVLLWNSIATKKTSLLRRGLSNLSPIPENTSWLTYIRSHDDIGLGFSDKDAQSCGYDPFLHRQFLLEYYTGRFKGSYATGELFMYNQKTKDARLSGTSASLLGLEAALAEENEEEADLAIRRLLLLYGIVMTFGGIPIVYYGDEVAYTNDYSYLEEDGYQDDNRWMHRPKIDWKKIEKRKKKGTIEHRVFSEMKKLIALRKKHPIFAHTNPAHVIDIENPHVFSFSRENTAGRILVLANMAPHEHWVNGEVLVRTGLRSKITDMYSGKEPELYMGNIKLEPYQFLCLKEKR